MKKFVIAVMGIMIAATTIVSAADLDGFLYYSFNPGMIGENSGIYAWDFTPGSVWKAPFSAASIKTKGLEVSYNSFYDTMNVISSSLVWPFSFGNLSLGLVSMTIPGMTTLNSQMGFMAGYGITLLNGDLEVGANLGYYNYRVDVYAYDMLTASLGVSYNFLKTQNKYLRPLMAYVNFVDIGLYSQSSLDGFMSVPAKFGLGVKYDLFELLYIPNNKMYLIINMESTSEEFRFSAAAAYMLKDIFKAMVSFDGSLAFGLGIDLLGVSVNYWIDPGIGFYSALGLSQRISVSIDFDMLGSGQGISAGNSVNNESAKVKQQQRDDMYQEALKLYNDEKYAESIKVLNELLNIDPDYQPAVELMKKSGEGLDRLIKAQEKK